MSKYTRSLTDGDVERICHEDLLHPYCFSLMFPHLIQLKTEKEEDLFSIRVQVKREGGSVTQEQLGSYFTSNSRRNPTTRQLKMNKFAILLCFSLFALHSSQATETEDGQDIIQRFIRAAAASPKKQGKSLISFIYSICKCIAILIHYHGVSR